MVKAITSAVWARASSSTPSRIGVVVQKAGDDLHRRCAPVELRAALDEPRAQPIALGIGALRQPSEIDGHRLDRAHQASEEGATERGIGVALLRARAGRGRRSVSCAVRAAEIVSSSSPSRPRSAPSPCTARSSPRATGAVSWSSVRTAASMASGHLVRWRRRASARCRRRRRTRGRSRRRRGCRRARAGCAGAPRPRRTRRAPSPRRPRDAPRRARRRAAGRRGVADAGPDTGVGEVLHLAVVDVQPGVLAGLGHHQVAHRAQPGVHGGRG